MKIKSLHARKVHGYLDLDIEFNDDITFITGLNGSGKTSAMRILLALLTPKIDELTSIKFDTASVEAIDNGKKVTIEARKDSDGIIISVSDQEETLSLSSVDIQLIAESSLRREESSLPVVDKLIQHPVIVSIKELSTPMFLGLDRRFYAPGLGGESDQRTRYYSQMSRQFGARDMGFRGASTAGLSDVQSLFTTRMQEVRKSQGGIDEDLRSQILRRAFEYKHSGIESFNRMPKMSELEGYRKRLEDIAKAADSLKIPVPELKSALMDFFDQMTLLVENLEKSEKSKSKSSQNKRGKYILEWIINKSQADRIMEHLRLLDKYDSDREEIRTPINKFLSLINGFLSQTGKKILIGKNDSLRVKLNGEQINRNINALSSGEKQLLVMIAHLSLNVHLATSGVFIVDEPELSLHLDWQERFVDAVREANKEVQLILATHSPAIILDRTDKCKSLS